METSILTSTKKVLGFEAAYTVFDQDIIVHVNAALSILEQLGIGPPTGFMIEDDVADWADFVLDIRQQTMARQYVFLYTRLYFDPPGNAYLVDAFKTQIGQLEFRMGVRREHTEWVDPEPIPPVVE